MKIFAIKQKSETLWRESRPSKGTPVVHTETITARAREVLQNDVIPEELAR